MRVEGYSGRINRGCIYVGGSVATTSFAFAQVTGKCACAARGYSESVSRRRRRVEVGCRRWRVLAAIGAGHVRRPGMR